MQGDFNDGLKLMDTHYDYYTPSRLRIGVRQNDGFHFLRTP